MEADTGSTVTIIAILIVLGAAAFWWWRRKRAFTKASGMAKSVFPVWAALGPFDSGKQSAAAMRYAFMACELEIDERTLNGHELAYDRNPEEWEQNRLKATEHRSEDTEFYVTVARSFEAAEFLGLSIVEDRYREVLSRGGDEQELTVLTATDLKIRKELSVRSKS